MCAAWIDRAAAFPVLLTPVVDLEANSDGDLAFDVEVGTGGWNAASHRSGRISSLSDGRLPMM